MSLLKLSALKSRVLKAGVLLLTLLALSACSDPDQGEGWIADGPDVSDIMLRDQEGRETSIGSYQGKVLIINFWATWCAPCRKEMPALQALSEALDPSQYVVIGVAVDTDMQAVEDFLQAHSISFQQYLDPLMQVSMQQLKVEVFPETLIVDADSQLVRRIKGERHWDDPEVYEPLLKGL